MNGTILSLTTASSHPDQRSSPARAPRGRMLLLRLLAGTLLGEREALGLFAARGAFLYVVSALAISHKTFTLTLSRAVPSHFGESEKEASTARWDFLILPALAKANRKQHSATMHNPEDRSFIGHPTSFPSRSHSTRASRRPPCPPPSSVSIIWPSLRRIISSAGSAGFSKKCPQPSSDSCTRGWLD